MSPTRYMSAFALTHKAMHVRPGHVFYSQGDLASSIYYLESGRAKLVVVSARGKEATISLMVPHDFIGEEALAEVAGLRSATAMSITACTVLRLDRNEMSELLHGDLGFSDMFLQFVLTRTIRIREDLVDQLFNSSEKRLARMLLIMADFSDPENSKTLLPPVTQEALADMIGTTRSRVSKFMNRFRQLGYISYNGRIHVHKTLLRAALDDRLHERRTKEFATPDSKLTATQKISGLVQQSSANSKPLELLLPPSCKTTMN